MLVSGQQFMLAKSTVYLTDRSWVDTVERDNVPIGQLLWHMGVLPAFKLHFAGRGLGFFWRVYQVCGPRVARARRGCARRRLDTASHAWGPAAVAALFARDGVRDPRDLLGGRLCEEPGGGQRRRQRGAVHVFLTHPSPS